MSRFPRPFPRRRAAASAPAGAARHAAAPSPAAPLGDGPTPDEAPVAVPWRLFVGVYVLLFLIGTETFLVSPLLPTISDSIGVTETAAASTVTAYTLAYALTAPFLGAVSDRFGRRPTIVAGAVLFVLGNLVAAVAGTLEVLVVARVVGALGAALAGPSIWAHLAERSPEEARGRAIGSGLALFSAGQVLGVPLASLLAGVGGWRASFWGLTILSALVLPLVWRQTRPVAAPAVATPAEAGRDARTNALDPATAVDPAGRGVPAARPAGAPAAAPRLRLSAVFAVWTDPLLRRVLLVVFLLQGANLGAYTFIGAVLDDRFDLSVTALGLLGVLVGTGSAIGSVLAGRISDAARRAGRDDRAWIPAWSVLLGVGAVAAAFGQPLVVACLAIVVWFVASGAFGANVQTLLIEARPALAATSSSWNSAVLYGGTAIGVLLVGAFGSPDVGVAVVGGGLALLATVLGATLAHPRLRPDARPAPTRSPDIAPTTRTSEV